MSVLQMAHRLQPDSKDSKVSPVQADLCFHLSCPRITTTQTMVTEESPYVMENRIEIINSLATN